MTQSINNQLAVLPTPHIPPQYNYFPLFASSPLFSYLLHLFNPPLCLFLPISRVSSSPMPRPRHHRIRSNCVRVSVSCVSWEVPELLTVCLDLDYVCPVSDILYDATRDLL